MMKMRKMMTTMMIMNMKANKVKKTRIINMVDNHNNKLMDMVEVLKCKHLNKAHSNNSNCLKRKRRKDLELKLKVSKEKVNSGDGMDIVENNLTS